MWGLIPMPWKLIGAGVIVAILGWGVMRWRSSLIEEGMERGRQQQLKADEARMNEEQEAARAEIDGLRSALDISQALNAAARAADRQARTELYKGLDEKLAAIAAGGEVGDAGIANIPGDKLDASIRAELSRLGEPGGGTAGGVGAPDGR
jgi:hypothetical protein